jgi:hypothetical protein
MTRITTSVGEEVLTGRYPDPAKCSYLYYTCTYCLEEFMLVDPDRNFEAGGAIRHTLYRNPDTGEVGAVENRSVGVCKACAILMLQQQQQQEERG